MVRREGVLTEQLLLSVRQLERNTHDEKFFSCFRRLVFSQDLISLTPLNGMLVPIAAVLAETVHMEAEPALLR